VLKGFLLFWVRWIVIFGGLTLLSMGMSYMGWRIPANFIMLIVVLIGPIHPFVRLWFWFTRDSDADERRRHYRLWFLGNMNERS
jgi:hypothetical protein|tara:strand:+ start:164 stop:415 length:252 start_codon:yes stop_codon:yes gene_type:complete